MRVDHFKRVVGILLFVLTFITFPGSFTAAVAAPFGVDLMISGDRGATWSNVLDNVLVGTFLIYKLTGTAITETVTITDILATSFLGRGAVVTDTITASGGPVDLRFWWGVGDSPGVKALLGTHTAFVTATGHTSPDSYTVYAYATYTGISSAVPEPATLLLIGSGLLGLAGLRKKLKK